MVKAVFDQSQVFRSAPCSLVVVKGTPHVRLAQSEQHMTCKSSCPVALSPLHHGGAWVGRGIQFWQFGCFGFSQTLRALHYCIAGSKSLFGLDRGSGQQPVMKATLRTHAPVHATTWCYCSLLSGICGCHSGPPFCSDGCGKIQTRTYLLRRGYAAKCIRPTLLRKASGPPPTPASKAARRDSQEA